MPTKHTSQVLANCDDEEPIFVLAGRDRFGSMLVKIWAVICRQHGVSEEKCLDAERVADEMDKWQPKSLPD